MSKKTGIIAAVMALVVVAVGVGSYYLDGDDVLGAMKRRSRFTRPTISKTIATPKPAYNERRKSIENTDDGESTAGIYLSDPSIPGIYTATITADNKIAGKNSTKATKGDIYILVAKLKAKALGNTVFGASYQDCPLQSPTTAEQQSYCYLNSYGLLNSGYDLSYMEAQMQRYRVAKLFQEALAYPVYTPTSPTYIDIDPYGWTSYYAEIETLTREGIVDSKSAFPFIGELFYPSHVITTHSLGLWYDNANNNLP